MKTLFFTSMLLSSFSIFAADCVFHTTDRDGRVISQNSIYEAESKSIIDKRSGIKIEFNKDSASKNSSELKLLVSDLEGSKIFEKTFNKAFVDQKTGLINLPNGMYFNGSCTSNLYALTNIIDNKEWDRRSELEAQCMGRKKKSKSEERLIACEKKLEESSESKTSIVDTAAREAKAIEVFLENKESAVSTLSK